MIFTSEANSIVTTKASNHAGQTAQCIYCLGNFDNGTAVQSREHLFPKAFGCPDNLVLTCVCHDCNQKFSRQETWLTRDSVEALKRYRTRRPDTNNRGTTFRRIKLIIPYDSAEYGCYRGMHLRLYPAKRSVTTFPIQLGVRFGYKLYKYATYDTLTAPGNEHDDLREQFRSLHRGGYRVYGTTVWDGSDLQRDFDYWHQTVHGKDCPTDYFAFMRKLSLLGVVHLGAGQFKTNESLPQDINDTSGSVVLVSSTIDTEVQRALAKVAFNIAAWNLRPEAMLRKRFDSARSFIMSGDGDSPITPMLKRAAISREPVKDHFFAIEQVNGHLIVRIAFYSHQIYEINLADDQAVWFSHCYTFKVGDPTLSYVDPRLVEYVKMDELL